MIHISNKSLLDKFDSRAVQFATKDHASTKSRSRIVYMEPDVFLNLAKPLPYRNEIKIDRLEDLISHGIKLSDLPLLVTKMITPYVFRVIGHEGRHRSIVLSSMYPGKILPVIVRDSDVRWLEDGYVGGDKITLVSENSRKREVVIL